MLEKIIYMACIIDGVGSINIGVRKPSLDRQYYQYSMQLNIINTNYSLISWLQSNFGGRIDTRKKIEGRKICYRWQIASENAANILEQCLPYMIVKKQQAELLIESRKLMGRHGQIITDEIREKRLAIALKCKELNKFG